MKQRLTFLFFSLVVFASASEAIGTWQDYLSYRSGVAVCKAGNKVYCATNPSLFYYDTEDNSVNKMGKSAGLSDLDVTVIKYSDTYNTLIIGYENGNIDLLVNNDIINIPDVTISSIQGNRSINEVLINGEDAYLSTGFGIIKINLPKKEISETFTVGPGGTYLTVYETCVFKDSLFAATSDGIYCGSLQDNLIDFQNWSQCSNVPSGDYNTIVAFGDKIVTNHSLSASFIADTAYHYENGIWSQVSLGTGYNYGHLRDINIHENGNLIACFSGYTDEIDENYSTVTKYYTYGDGLGFPSPQEAISDGTTLWIADDQQGLIKAATAFSTEIFKPTGPHHSDSWGIEYQNGHLWVATGSLANNFKYTFSDRGIAHFTDGGWISYQGGDLFADLRAVHSLAINPNDPNHIFASSYGGGVMEFKDGEKIATYNDSNSKIQSISLFSFYAAGDLTFDKNDDLWIVNGGLSGYGTSNPLVMYDLEGNWYSYSLNSYFDATHLASKILIDKNDNKWVSGYLKGIAVFNENGTPTDNSDDDITLLSSGENSGNLPSNEIYAMAEDQDGKILIGGSDGLAVISSTTNLFSSGVTAEKIIIENDGNTDYLLAEEIISVIKIDAGNRKWIGTEGSGVFLISADLQEEIYHFNTLNSPLISDIVIDIDINDESGEVYISTDKGLVSFMGDANDNDLYSGPTYAYPNPVPPDYTGTVAIKGVPNNSEVKITDITGNTVYETISNGGIITWDGNRLNGSRVQSGVYLVLVSNSDGSETEIVKILFLN